MYVIQYVRSLIFVVQMYAAMAVLGIIYAPWALVSEEGAFGAVHAFSRWVRFSAHWLVGLKTEVRGRVPTGEVLVASKHQSFLDIIILVSVLPRPKFIMKQELRRAPILGWFAKRIGCVPVDRGARGAAVQQMIAGVKDPNAPRGQLIIYPQGTRVAPGAAKTYKVGVGALYAGLGQAVVPAATNVGVFWARTGVYRKPGLAVVEFLPVVEPGLPVPQIMEQLETVIEEASDRLMSEAGFTR